MIFSAMLAVSLQAAPVPAAPPATTPANPTAQLSLEQRTALRCAAAFALGAEAQARGDPQAANLPPLAQRGREYFVRLSARIMDDTGLPRGAIAAALVTEAEQLVSRDERHSAVPPCLVLLDAAGL